MVDDVHKQAVKNCRYWYARYRRLPRWRKRAREKALGNALYWGAAAIKAKPTD